MAMEESSQAMTAVLSCSILEINRIKKMPVSSAQKNFCILFELEKSKRRVSRWSRGERCEMDIRATKSVKVRKFKIFLDEMQRQFRNKKLSFRNERLLSEQNSIQTMTYKDYTNGGRECGGKNSITFQMKFLLVFLSRSD